MIFIIRGSVRYTHYSGAREGESEPKLRSCILAGGGATRMIYGVTKGLALHPWQVAFAYLQMEF
jgi:hypothetical protein